jgi:tungstate transport system ATP-binding protein
MEAAVSAANEYGTTVIVATHDLAWLYEMSTDVVSLYRGRVVGSGAENLLQGKWRLTGGYMVREFIDGQAVFAYQPQSGRPNAAMLNSAGVRLFVERPDAAHDMNIIRGRIVQMTLERATDSVLVSIEVGENVIKTRMEAAELNRLELCPSKMVYLTFSYAAVRWI